MGQADTAARSPTQLRAVALRGECHSRARGWRPCRGRSLRCDARIVPDVRFLLERFGLRLTECFAASGHAIGGDHPLGLAVDVVPSDGNWTRTLEAARYFAWSPDCASSGCAGRVRAPTGVVLYNAIPATEIQRTARRPRALRTCTSRGPTGRRRR